MESMKLEYKKTFGKEVIISLVAFANTDGGKVIIGIDDAPPITPPIRDDVQIHATGLETRILQILGQNPRISTGGIAGILEVRPDTVKEYLARMKAKGLIAREGSPRSGIWRVIDRAPREKQS